MGNIISVKNVTYKYPDGYEAISDMSFNIEEGEKVGIIGANGAGKSTLLQLLVATFITKEGSIEINKILATKKNIRDIRNNVGYIFQEADNQLFMNKVFDDIAFGLRNNSISEDNIHKKVKEILGYMSIEHLANKNIYKLSGGQKRMVAIAGILVMEPKVILMDEPSSSLDPKSRRKLINLLIDLKNTVIIASHDLDMILEVCDKVILINNGQVICKGNTKDILTNKQLLEDSNLELPLSLSHVNL